MKPLLRAARADAEIHGSDGLGGVQGLPDFIDGSVQARIQQGRTHTAIEAMAQALRQNWDDGHGGRTTIVTTGPQTNLALFLSVYPDLGKAIEEIVFMGGGVGLGNRSAAAGMTLHFSGQTTVYMTFVSVRIQHSMRSCVFPKPHPLHTL